MSGSTRQVRRHHQPGRRRASRSGVPALSHRRGRIAAGRRPRRSRCGRRPDKVPVHLRTLPVHSRTGGVPAGAVRPGDLRDARRTVPCVRTGLPPGPRHGPAQKRTGGGSCGTRLAEAVLACDWRANQALNRDVWIYHILRREAEGLILPNLSAFLEGKYRPRDHDEQLAMLGACLFTNRTRMSARLYADAFARRSEFGGRHHGRSPLQRFRPCGRPGRLRAARARMSLGSGRWKENSGASRRVPAVAPGGPGRPGQAAGPCPRGPARSGGAGAGTGAATRILAGLRTIRPSWTSSPPMNGRTASRLWAEVGAVHDRAAGIIPLLTDQ